MVTLTKMSNSNVDNDGFHLVGPKKRISKRKPSKVPERVFKIEQQDTIIDVEKSKQRILAAVDDIKSSPYYQTVTNSVSTLLESKSVVEIVCFGLGHLAECTISRYQLALLLCIRDLFKPKKVLVHDPVFYKAECQILKDLQLELIEKNSEGSYVIAKEGTTFVYLPHCPKQLTNNFLFSNWSQNLQNCILICNSFTSLFENQPNRIIQETVPYIHKIQPHTTEIAVENNFKFTDIFNDTSIHIFPKETLGRLDSDFWAEAVRPSYNDTEEFITSCMIEKLTL